MPLFPSYRDFQRLEFKVDAIAKQLGVVIRHEDFLIHLEKEQMLTEADIKAQSDDLIAKVANLTQVDQALGTYIQGLKDQQTVLAQELADAIANGANQDTLTAISNNIMAAAQQIDAAAATDAVLVGTTPPVVTPPDTVPTPPPGAPPVIASISPNAGMAVGGQTVTISGTNLGAVTGVTFGGVPATGIIPDHDSSLQVTTPAGTGTVDVVVTTPVGDSDPMQFSYA